MKQTRDESKFIPYAQERGRARLIQKTRLSYSLLCNMGSAHSARLFLFRSEGAGYARALSYPHNHARFRNKRILLPRRERGQYREYLTSDKREARRSAIVALKYGRRYGTTTINTIERANTAGIMIRRDERLIVPIAEIQRRISALINGSEMKGI